MMLSFVAGLLPDQGGGVGKRLLTTFYLLWRHWRQTQYIQACWRSINGRAGFGAVLPEGF